METLVKKAKYMQKHIEALEEEIIDLNAKIAVMEHDNNIQEKIILQLNYEKYKDLVDK